MAASDSAAVAAATVAPSKPKVDSIRVTFETAAQQARVAAVITDALNFTGPIKTFGRGNLNLWTRLMRGLDPLAEGVVCVPFVLQPRPQPSAMAVDVGGD